ncbi:hypothetical protein [uncultured Sunxiuqinia sp.]|uniref:hypothetical protein n=1 Tax=uncultured Sunxiuqinia sp. TaxID=1573825 RepID=UPI00261BFEEF|nr:hypothetical protein [uncultured Sunxiuqinia sp.]
MSNEKRKYQYRLTLMLIGVSLLFQTYQVMGQDQTSPMFEKGTWHTGFTMNLNNTSSENLDNLLFNVGKFDNTGFGLNFSGGYFLADDISAGIKYSYQSKEMDAIYEWNEENARYQSAKSNHRMIFFLRNYYPISPNGRFSFFNETDLGVDLGSSVTRHTKSEKDITKSYSEEFSLALGVKPGMAVVLTRGFAFEVSVGLLGLTYTNKNVTTDGVKEGSRDKFNFDFDISLLSLDFGLAYYF